MIGGGDHVDVTLWFSLHIPLVLFNLIPFEFVLSKSVSKMMEKMDEEDACYTLDPRFFFFHIRIKIAKI